MTPDIQVIVIESGLKTREQAIDKLLPPAVRIDTVFGVAEIMPYSITPLTHLSSPVNSPIRSTNCRAIFRGAGISTIEQNDEHADAAIEAIDWRE